MSKSWPRDSQRGAKIKPKIDKNKLNKGSKRGMKKVMKKVCFWDLPDPPDRGSRVGGSVIFTKSACSKSDPKKLPELGRKPTENQ